MNSHMFRLIAWSLLIIIYNLLSITYAYVFLKLMVSTMDILHLRVCCDTLIISIRKFSASNLCIYLHFRVQDDWSCNSILP